MYTTPSKTSTVAWYDIEVTRPVTTLEVEGELTVTHEDMEELYTIFTDDRYDGKGLELQGKHIIKLPKPMYLLDAEIYHPLTKGETRELTEAYIEYTKLVLYKHSRARFWDVVNKAALLLWLLFAILFLLRMWL